MGFVFKSLFWAGIVVLFLPRELSAPDHRMMARAHKSVVNGDALLDAASASAGFCRAQPEICESALKTGSAGRDIFAAMAAGLSARLQNRDAGTK